MKRGSSGLSLVVGVNKQRGMTSHDVVNACRRIFGEKRVGHAGTLDPLAEGVLPVLIGPAARLDSYMTAHEKTYRVHIAFGCETETDDSEGRLVETGNLFPDLYDEDFARSFSQGLVGTHEQVPPRYSAVKIEGKRSYALARDGVHAEIPARTIEIVRCCFIGMEETPDYPLSDLAWVLDVTVSKGTYIRSLARDIGREFGCFAHVSELERRASGAIGLERCVSLDTLAVLKEDAAIDPVWALGYPFAFADSFSMLVSNGGFIPQESLILYDSDILSENGGPCECTSMLQPLERQLMQGETVAIIVENKLKALYRCNRDRNGFEAVCVFSIGVFRG